MFNNNNNNRNFFNNNNGNDTLDFIITDYLSLVRSQHNILNNIINSMSSSNHNTVNIINSYVEMRRHRDISLNSHTTTYTNTSTTNTSTTNSDISNNFTIPRSRRRPRYSYPPPPPPPTSNTSRIDNRHSQVRYYNNPRTRRAGRTTTFYTPFLPTSTSTTRNNITSFINNTLWDATSNANLPASIKCIINNTTLHKWCDIKSDHTSTERCPIDLSILNDDDIVLQINHCKHIFKYKNIFRWFAINSKCPVCRYNIIDSSNNLTSNNTSQDTVSDISNNISLSVTDISFNDIDASNNTTLNEIRRRVENLLNLDSSDNMITADITFSIEPNNL